MDRTLLRLFSTKHTCKTTALEWSMRKLFLLKTESIRCKSGWQLHPPRDGTWKDQMKSFTIRREDFKDDGTDGKSLHLFYITNDWGILYILTLMYNTLICVCVRERFSPLEPSYTYFCIVYPPPFYSIKSRRARTLVIAYSQSENSTWHIWVLDAWLNEWMNKWVN